MRVVYFRNNFRNLHQQQNRLEHTVAINEAGFNLYRQPKSHLTKEWLRPVVESSLVAVSSRLGYRVMVILAVDTRDRHHGTPKIKQ